MKRTILRKLIDDENEIIQKLSQPRFVAPPRNISTNSPKIPKSNSYTCLPKKISKPEKENYVVKNNRADKRAKRVKERTECYHKVMLKQLEEKCYETRSTRPSDLIMPEKLKAELKILKEDFKNSCVRVTHTELGGHTIKPHRLILKKGHFNDFFNHDEKSIHSDNRPFYTAPICGSCGQSKYNHCSLVCGNIQMIANYSKEVLQKCPMCGKLERMANHQYCDLCTSFVTCSICKKEICRKGNIVCQNCLFVASFVTCSICKKKTCRKGSTICQYCLSLSPQGRNI